MNESTKKWLERTVYVIFFVVAMFAVRTYKARHSASPPAPPAVSAGDSEQTKRKEEFRKKQADYEAKEAAGHAARVKKLGEAGAKAQEDRCDAELMAAFQALVDRKPQPETPDCDE
jgi:hypothetical protein